MARIRTIKPQFWDDTKIRVLSRDERLLYIGMWNFADDLGVVNGDQLWLKSKIFPYDQIQVQQFGKWIADLARHGFIRLLSYNGEGFVYLPNFARHQVINRPNLQDLNIPKDVLDKLLAATEDYHGAFTDESLNNHGTFTDGKGIGKGEEKDMEYPPNPQGAGRVPQPSCEAADSSFEEFWNLYDKKVGNKEKLRSKWDKLSVKDKEAAFAHVPLYKAATPEKRYRKNPETYLNNRSWNDEIIEDHGNKRKKARYGDTDPCGFRGKGETTI